MSWYNFFNSKTSGDGDVNRSGEEIEKVVDVTKDDLGSEVTKEVQIDDGYGTVMPGSSPELHRYLAAPVSTNKQKRLNEYRAMAYHVEVADSVDEISDGAYNLDENGKFCKLQFKCPIEKLGETKRATLNTEFEYFVNLFDFEEHSFEYVRKFVIEGELAFENVIDPKHPNKGVLSVKPLDNDHFEYLKDLSTAKNIGILFNVPKKSITEILSPSFSGSAQFFKEITVNTGMSAYNKAWNEGESIPLLWSQLTYINSGLQDLSKCFVYPYLDKARQAYKQLKLIEDGVIIYRVARSPERLVFNVASGNTSAQKAQSMLLQAMKRFSTRKATRTGGEGQGITNFYDAHQPVESFWFLKPSEGEGSSVESIGGQSSFGELEDLRFFTRKLYRALKVPFSRFEQPENTISQGDSVSYEEYRFGKALVRINLAFGSGLYEGFKTHLKLKGIWKQFNLNSQDIRIDFTKPILFDLYETARLNEIRMESYSNVADNENFSWTLAMKNILNMSDGDIKNNIDSLKKEKILEAELNFWGEKVEEFGSLERAEKEVKKEFDTGDDDNY